LESEASGAIHKRRGDADFRTYELALADQARHLKVVIALESAGRADGGGPESEIKLRRSEGLDV
jgi:hypothetical protein